VASIMKGQSAPGVLKEPDTAVSRSRRRLLTWAAGAVLVALGFFVPQIVQDQSWLDVLGQGLLLGIAATGVGMLIRQCGLVNFGSGAMYGGAAYIIGIAANQWGMSATTAALVSLLVIAVVLVVVGALIIRTGHLAFALLTLAFSQMLLVLINTPFAADWTGAEGGMVISQEGTFLGMTGRDLFQPESFWYLAWICAVVAVLASLGVEHSRLGSIARAVKTNEERMRFMGYDTFTPKLTIYVIGGLMGAVAGILSGMHFAFASPELLGIHNSGNIVTSALIGGTQWPIGPMFGGIVFAIGQDQFAAIHQQALFTGLGVIVAIVLLRRGLVGAILSAAHWVSARAHRRRVR
jgi:branched-chain amino acid transport system permease protein